MMSIKILDENTINKIAAGEVIENASSVVKELVENSIDARAKNISIFIEEAGLKLIKVVDDGNGINKDDIKLAFKEHATSKLIDIKDLEDISSFGFRGEALPSIAAISEVSVITKSADESNAYGYRYDVTLDSELEKEASNVGTAVIVRNLFKNVPVRKKFLKGISKENSLIQDYVTKLALSKPDISFNLIIDGRQRFKSKGDGNLRQIIYELYGKEIYDNLVEVDGTEDGIKVYGFIAKPIIARNTRLDEIYFVNYRYIKSKVIYTAIENAYEPYLMQYKYPLAILMISVDSSIVDVNVHPKKLEVRFSSDEKVNYAVYNIITKTLKDINLIHEEKIDEILDFNSDNIDISENYDKYSVTTDYEKEEPKENFEDKSIDNDSKVKILDDLPSLADIFNKKYDEGISITNLHKNLSERSFIEKTLTEDHKYIGQVFNTYILVEFEEKLYIIDQHAAHEKINFEKLMRQYAEGKVLSQKIFPSIVLKLSIRQYEAVENNISEFEKVGFELDVFGDREIKVDAVPYNIYDIGNEKFLMDIIDSFVDENNKEHYDSIVEKIASISCKKSIKANHVLSETEVKELLRELFKLDNPYNCPHGRPTIISLSKYEFEKKFGRVI